MNMIPFAPAAPPPAGPPAAASASAPDGPDLSGVFSALVSALSQEFLAPGDGSGADGAPPVPTDDGAEAVPDETGAASVAAMLLTAPTTAATTVPALHGSPDGDGTDHLSELPSELPVAAPVDGEADALTAHADPPDSLAPADLVPDSDVEPPLGPRADGSVEAAATEVAAAETGVAADSGVPEDLGNPDTGAGSIGDVGEPLETDSTTPDTDPASTDGPETIPARTGAPIPSPGAAPADGAAAGPAPAQTAPAAAVDSPAAAVDSPAAPATSARTAAPALPDQLVTVLTPLRSAPDGTHRVAIQLRPDELGEVQIDVVVRGNEIALNVRADLPGTADLLRASLAELRAELEAAGFDAGDLDVAHHGPDAGADPSDGPRADGPEDDRTAADGGVGSGADVPATPSTTSATGLDLRL